MSKTNLFKNMKILENFYRTYKIKNNQKIYLNQINLKIELNTIDIISNQIKYFKLISHNHFENSINNEISKKEKSITDYENISTINSSFNNVPNFKNTGIFEKKILKILGENTKSYLKKHSLKTTTSNDFLLELNDLQKENLSNVFNLNFDIKKENYVNVDQEMFSFFIYAYDVNDELIEKWKSEDINISLSIEKNIDEKEFSNDDLKGISLENMFDVIIERSIETKSRKLLLTKTEYGKKIIDLLIKSKLYSKFFKSIKLLEYINDQLIDEKKINISSLEKEDSLAIQFTQEYTFNDNISDVYYILVLEDNFKKLCRKKIKFENIDYFLENDTNIFLSKIKEDVIRIENSLKNDVLFVKVIFENSLNINSKYIPAIANVYLNDNEIIENVFTNEKFTKSLELKNKKVTDSIKLNQIIFYHKVKNIFYDKDNTLKIVFKNNYDNKICVFNQKIVKEYTSIAKINLFTNSTSFIEDEYSGNIYRYNIDYTKFYNQYTNNNISSLLKNQDLNQKLFLENEKNIDKILSNENKDKILKDVNLNKFYLIVKKNIKYFNISKDLFEIIEIKNLEDIENIYINDDISNPHLKENSIEYEKIKNKTIQFETKILSIPANLFYKNVSEINVKSQIKETFLTNIQNQNEVKIPSDELINLIYDAYQKINSKGTVSLNEHDLNLLFNTVSLNTTWAKSDLQEYKKKESISRINKQILINSKIEDVIFDKKEKNIKTLLSLNIEELTSLNLNKEKVFEIIENIIKNSFKGFYYKNNYSNEVPDSEISNIIKANNILGLNWIDNNNNLSVSEMNSNMKFNIYHINKNVVNVEIYLSLKDIPSTLRLFSILSIYKQVNFKKNLFQKIVMNKFSFQIDDRQNFQKKIVEISVKNTNETFILYDEIKDICSINF